MGENYIQSPIMTDDDKMLCSQTTMGEVVPDARHLIAVIARTMERKGLGPHLAERIAKGFTPPCLMKKCQCGKAVMVCGDCNAHIQLCEECIRATSEEISISFPCTICQDTFWIGEESCECHSAGNYYY